MESDENDVALLENNDQRQDWWNPEAGLTPEKLDKMIDAVNSLNDVFGKINYYQFWLGYRIYYLINWKVKKIVKIIL